MLNRRLLFLCFLRSAAFVPWGKRKTCVTSRWCSKQSPCRPSCHCEARSSLRVDEQGDCFTVWKSARLFAMTQLTTMALLLSLRYSAMELSHCHVIAKNLMSHCHGVQSSLRVDHRVTANEAASSHAVTEVASQRSLAMTCQLRHSRLT
jgi:hypothetical protein